jgi:hypothetical protein
MANLKAKYHGRELSGDEYALAHNEIDAAQRELEEIEYTCTGDDYLLLKWGTLKGWNFTSERGIDLLKQYSALGSSASAMMQKDTPEQKEIICQLIDECNGSIQNDWTGEYMTKEEAKHYVREYGKDII